jgi:hypothetical protein
VDRMTLIIGTILSKPHLYPGVPGTDMELV